MDCSQYLKDLIRNGQNCGALSQMEHLQWMVIELDFLFSAKIWDISNSSHFCELQVSTWYSVGPRWGYRLSSISVFAAAQYILKFMNCHRTMLPRLWSNYFFVFHLSTTDLTSCQKAIRNSCKLTTGNCLHGRSSTWVSKQERHNREVEVQLEGSGIYLGREARGECCPTCNVPGSTFKKK